LPAGARAAGVSAALAALAALAAAGTGRAAAEATPPVNTSPPAIGGTLRAGQVLTVSSGWDGTSPIDYSYQWQRCDPSGANCASIGDATGQSYLLVPADVGGTIRVVVAAANSAGTTSATSSATALVAAPPAAPTESVSPGLNGAALVGSTLAVGSGTWNGDPPIAYSYQWQRCTLSGSCEDIVAATGPTYTAVAADSGKQIRARVTAANNVSSNQALSNLSDVVTGGPGAPSSKAAPVLAGLAQVGQTLTVSSGAWSGRPPFTFLYQWQRCDASVSSCRSIADATAQSYTAVAADSGKRLAALVTAVVDAGAGRTRSSLSEIVSASQTAPAGIRPPSIAGTAEVGQTLLATTGSWTGTPPLAYSYQWQRCTRPGSCESIQSATGRAYQPGPADRGATLQVVVTASNANGSASATSSRSAAVAAAASSSAIVLGNGLTSVPASSLSLPDRLVIDRVQQSPPVVRSRDPFTVRVRVSDLSGRVVRGALVQVLAIPAGVVANAPERATRQDGWVSFRLRPTGRLQLQTGSPLSLFVRARKQGETLLAGISNRRLVQVRLGPPTAG